MFLVSKDNINKGIIRKSDEHTRFYRKTMVNYNGEAITFIASEQTVRDLPKEGEIITVYKDKNGIIYNNM